MVCDFSKASVLCVGELVSDGGRVCELVSEHGREGGEVSE